YQFNGEDLSLDPNVCLQVEDGYWTKSEAAVVFRHHDRRDGRTRYIYHGNDGTSIPWNDTAQLNYLLPEVREAVIRTILHVARNFPIIRFDAAMTLAKKHYQRLWFPVRGLGGGIPSRAEHGMSREEFDAAFPVEFWREVVDRVAAEAPGTLLLAEAFWLMEGYFVRTLGMHRVYNSAFMNMLKMEDNAKYRQTVKNVLEFNPEVLKRFVNFMNNPDEKTAVEQFGSQGKYFGACVLLATMPGLPMFGHGQIEGYREKYGMEYKRAYWDEAVDEGLVRGHEMWIFPLLRRRWLFSGSESFVLYDFYAGHSVDENVFAYSNRRGDQRALVLYHNRHAATAGWIRGSAAFAVKEGEGQTLRRTTLGEALGLADDERVYYAFRDQTEGLEYLRNGRELWEKGLYAELGEYQFHVFLDFREIREDAANSWGRLCSSLNGRGVESLEDEQRQVRYASLNQAFRAVLDQVPAAEADILAAAARGVEGIGQAAQRFLAILNAQADGRGMSDREVVQGLAASLAFLAEVQRAKTSAKSARAFGTRLTCLLGSRGTVCLLLAWLLLKDTGADAAALGLDTTLRRALVALGVPDTEARQGVHLVQALLSWGGARRKRGIVSHLETVFGDAGCRAFMLVHESSGVEWFNKERFEELLAWLAVASLAERSAKPPAGRTLTAWMNESEEELTRAAELAAHAGYRCGLFLRLALPAAGPGRAAQRSGRKGKDVQSGTGTGPARTPDDNVPR
ncbi:MAG TPA: alpha-amylase, partial [Desulfuromonadaceae bacterium]